MVIYTIATSHVVVKDMKQIEGGGCVADPHFGPHLRGDVSGERQRATSHKLRRNDCRTAAFNVDIEKDGNSYFAPVC